MFSGISSNILALAIFGRERIRITIWGVYLIVFSILSTILMLTVLSYILIVIRYGSGAYRLWSCQIIPFVTLMAIDGGILCTVAIAVERVFIGCYNFGISGSRLRSVFISFIIILYACGSNLDDIFIRRISEDSMGDYVCTYDFEEHPVWLRLDIGFSYRRMVIPCVVHLICSVCVLTTIARRKIFIRSTEKQLSRVWLQQLFLHRDFFIPPICLLFCILPHAIVGHVLHVCIPYSDKFKLRVHIAFALLLYLPQTLTFVLYVYPNEIYWKEFEKTTICRTFCYYAYYKRQKKEM